jgi:hypothetical protein
VYTKTVKSAVLETIAMHAALIKLEDEGIPSHQLRQAGFTLPPPRVDEEHRWALFNQSLYAALRSSPTLQAVYMQDPVRRALATSKGVIGERWSMSCVSFLFTPGKPPSWIMMVCDATRQSKLEGSAELRDHPWYNQALDKMQIKSEAPPSIDDIKGALFRAMLIPAAGAGPARIPERLSLSGDMGRYFAALTELGQEIGVKVSFAAQGASLPSEAAQHSRLTAQGWDLPTAQGVDLPATQGCDLVVNDDRQTGMPKGTAAKKKKKEKKK